MPSGKEVKVWIRYGLNVESQISKKRTHLLRISGTEKNAFVYNGDQHF